MSTRYHRLRSSFIPILFGLLLLVLFFYPLLFQNKVVYSGDTARGYLPQRTALLAALREQRLPWWEAELGVGYPLLAEGETGAFYPLNWLLLLFIPADISLNVSLILHTALAGLGTWLWLRRLHLPSTSAFLGGFIYSLGGVFSAHYSHLSIVTVAAWLPWLFTVSDWQLQASTKRSLIGRGLVLCVCTALQFTGGHAQISLLILLAASFYMVYRLWLDRGDTSDVQPTFLQLAARAGIWAAALLGGALLAGPQLAAGWQLSQLSDRAGGLDSAYFTSFSFHPLMAVTYLMPFIQGNPYPDGSVELMGYIGLLPLALAGAGLVFSRRRLKWFLAGLGLLGFLLACGKWNPLYALLLRIPVLNLFRVPARFMLWTSICLAGLAALGFESLPVSRAVPNTRRAVAFSVLLLAAVGSAMAWLLYSSNPDEMVRVWRWLPLIWTLVIILLAWGLVRIGRVLWIVLAASLVTADLYAYQAVLNATFNTAEAIDIVRQPPAVTELLRRDGGLFRVYTKEEILPIGFVQKASLYANHGLTYGQQSANLYMPLFPAAYKSYLDGLNASRLNALNVRYYLIPQLLPVDEASELYDVANPFANLPYNQWIQFSPRAVIAVEMESYLSHAAELPLGKLAGTLHLRRTDGSTITLPIRAGWESAEWAYERPDVAAVISYPMPTVAASFPARSGYPPVDHVGHTYTATWTFSGTETLSAAFIEPMLPEAFIRVERIWLHNGDGQPVLLNHLAGLGDHSIAYRSEDVLVYRNHDAWPRAFTVHAADVHNVNGGIRLTDEPQTLAAAAVTVYTDQRVTIEAQLTEPGYLVLVDMFYPGWHASVDGQPAEILLVDNLFRAVALEPGGHTIEFYFQYGFTDALRR